MDQVFLWKSHEGEEPPVGIRIRPRRRKRKGGRIPMPTGGEVLHVFVGFNRRARY